MEVREGAGRSGRGLSSGDVQLYLEWIGIIHAPVSRVVAAGIHFRFHPAPFLALGTVASSTFDSSSCFVIDSTHPPSWPSYPASSLLRRRPTFRRPPRFTSLELPTIPSPTTPRVNKMLGWKSHDIPSEPNRVRLAAQTSGGSPGGIESSSSAAFRCPGAFRRQGSFAVAVS